MAKNKIPTFKWFKETFEEYEKAKLSERDKMTGSKLYDFGMTTKELPTYQPFAEFIFDLAHSKHEINDICKFGGYTGKEMELASMLDISGITFSKWISDSTKVNNHRKPADYVFYQIAYIVAIDIYSKL